MYVLVHNVYVATKQNRCKENCTFRKSIGEVLARVLASSIMAFSSIFVSFSHEPD